MINNNYKLNVILLAAGKSERFNGIKLLSNVNSESELTTAVPFKKKPLSIIEHVLNQLSHALSELNIANNNLQIATGIYHQQLSALLGDDYSVHYCENAHQGLGHTIAQSVTAILEAKDTKKPSHVMITLADQVALTSDDYIRLIKQSRSTPNKVVCAKANQALMPPAIFPQYYFEELTKLQGDKGAKALLYKNKENLHPLLLKNAAIDIDTQQDLINWINK